MIGSKNVKTLTFDSSAGASQDQTVYMAEGASGRFSVFTKKTDGAGTCSVAVSGCFSANPESNDLFSIDSGSAGSSITNIVDSESSHFGYVNVAASFTGSAIIKVYLVSF